MPGQQITADLLLNIKSKELARELEDAIGSGIQKASRDAQRMVSNTFREATIHALTDGKVGQALRETMKSGIVDAQQQYEALIRQAEATKDKAEKKRLTEQAAATRKILDDRYKQFQREVQLQRDAAKAQREGAKKFAEGLESGAQSIRGMLSGDLFGNLAQAGKGLGGRLQARGEAGIAKAREAGLGGADPKKVAQMAKMGQALAKVGVALAAVAAVVGAVLILVKIFADIEAKAKDMNKALLESAGAADFGLGHVDVISGKLNERLQELRENTADLNDTFFKFGATAKEQQSILTQLNQAGFTYAKMTEGMTTAADRAKGYADALGAALTYSRALGVSSSQMAQTMGEFTLETGQGLEQVADQFSIITTEAMRAGFVTKRFYAAVTEATSGMAFYGVRLEETTKLLASFDSLLGETVGADAFKRLVGQYRDAGEQKKLQDIILKGEGFVAKELGRAFDLRVGELQRDFGERLGGANVAEMLTSMTEQELRQQLERQGFKPEDIRRFATAQRMGNAPKLGKGAMMEAMGSAGPGFDIAMAMQASQVFQGRSVGDVARQARTTGDQGAAIRVALSGVAEAQGMKLEQLVELFEQADSRWQNLVRIQEEIKKNGGDRTKLAQEDQDYLQRLEDKFGIEISTLGETISKDGVELTEAMDLVRSSSVDSGEKLSDQFSRDQEIAVGISENIYGLNEIMEQTIAKILNDIYGVVAAIARKYLMGSKEMEKVQAIEESRKYREKTQAELEKKRGDLRTIEVKLRTAEGEEREKLLKERERINSEAEKAAKDVKRAEVLEKAAKTGPAGSTLQRGEQKLAEAGVITKQQASLGGKYAESTIERMFGEVEASSSAIVAAWSDTPTKTIDALEDIEAEDITKEMRAGYEALDEETKKAFEQLYGKEAVAEAFKAAESAAIKKAEEVESIWTSEATEWEQIRGAAVGAFKSRLLQSAGGGGGGDSYTLDELRGSMENMPLLGDFNKQIISNLEMIAKATEETATATDTGIRIDVANAQKAKDLILPAAGGKPILTDEKDTLMAFQPGGPISGAMGGGRGGDVHIAIYGGDQKQVYDTVMKALKAVGRA